MKDHLGQEVKVGSRVVVLKGGRLRIGTVTGTRFIVGDYQPSQSNRFQVTLDLTGDKLEKPEAPDAPAFLDGKYNAVWTEYQTKFREWNDQLNCLTWYGGEFSHFVVVG